MHASTWSFPSWQQALADLITDPQELITLLELDPKWIPKAIQASKNFPLRIPRKFLTRIEKNNPDDPLLKQILPLAAELAVVPGFSQDPLEEKNANPLPGLLHKYAGRVLVTLTSACAIHCRYCFRRHFPYQENNPGRGGWQKLFHYIQQDPSINEVILSGGDPLAVSDKVLMQFCDGLRNIPHLQRLRIHTRLPIILPERITADFLQWLANQALHTVVVIHANHPQEINAEVSQALQAIKRTGTLLLNQSVLLKGINDELSILKKLSETLFAAGVLPYYLHLLDKVQGTAHFNVPLKKAKSLYQTLVANLPGFLVPKLVTEQAGAAAKTLLF